MRPRHSKPVLTTLVALLFSAGTLPAIAGALQFNVTALGAFNPTSINSLGQVAGWANSATGQQAVFYDGASMSSISAPSGNSFAYGVNNSGQIVGNYDDGQSHGFLYAGGSGSTLPSASLSASAINNSGQIVGSGTVNGDTHAYLYNGGTVTDLNTGAAGSGSRATAISSNGLVAGARWDSEFGESHAFTYANGTVTDLSSVVAGFSVATGINSSGQVILTVDQGNPDSRTSYVYANGVATDLGSFGLSTYAQGINSAGLVVGFADNFDWQYRQAGFVWQDGVMTDLNQLINPGEGWTILSAAAVNDNNQIAAFGCRNGGDCQALLLSVSAVPEPAAPAMLMAGLGLLGAVVRRRRSAPASRG